MDFLFHLPAIASLLCLLLVYLWKARTHIDNSKKICPPEPPGALPVIGHLHLLGGQNTIARTLGAIADKYGPIFTIRLGMRCTLVISNWESVKECFTTNDRVLGARPSSAAGKYLGYNYAGFGFIACGPYWREMRKLILLGVLSSHRLEKLQHVRVSEVDTTIKELYSVANKKKNGKSPAKVVISKWIEELTFNIIVRMIAGKRYFDGDDGAKDEEAQNFRRVIKEFMLVSGKIVPSDVIPFPLVRWVDLLGPIKSMKRIANELDSITDVWIQEHIQRRQKSEPGNEMDFIDMMLSVIDDQFIYGHTRETAIKATILNLILAGSDTTANNLTWLLSILLNNRQDMKRAQEEIEIKVGKDRWVEESDIRNLVYLQAIVKETLRLYPPGPLSVPHEAIEDCEVGGYHIRKGTRLLVNVWKLHRDTRIWSDPDKFMPERFLASHAEVDVAGQQFEYTPFGSGRRSCPGMTLAMHVMHLTLARLIQGFEFTTPSNAVVDMSEGQGITLPKATPLEVLITARLPPELYGH